MKSPMDYRSDIITETSLGIMGTISGLRPLFLLGHHGLTSDSTQLVPPVTHTDTREMQTAGRHATKGKSIAYDPRRERFPLPLVQTVLQVTGFHRDTDQTHASPRGRIGMQGVCVRDVGAPGEELRHRKPYGGNAGHPQTSKCLV